MPDPSVLIVVNQEYTNVVMTMTEKKHTYAMTIPTLMAETGPAQLTGLDTRRIGRR